MKRIKCTRWVMLSWDNSRGKSLCEKKNTKSEISNAKMQTRDDTTLSCSRRNINELLTSDLFLSHQVYDKFFNL